MKALIVYWSGTGNTEKVAKAIKSGLEKASVSVTMKRSIEALDEDLFGYDLVCLGAPTHQWLPAKQIREFVNAKLKEAFKKGYVKPNMYPVTGRNALIFATYSGPHTGINEAIPAVKWLGQFFEHLGFKVMDEWYVVAEYHGRLVESTKGSLGDIRGKPTQEELACIEEKITKLVLSLKHN